MAALSTVIKNQIRDSVVLGQSWLPLSDFKVGLYMNAVGDDDSGTEVSGGSYSRQTIVFQSEGDGAASNANEIGFLSMPATTVSHVAFFATRDGATPSTVLLAWGALALTRTIVVGDGITFPPGALVLTWN